MTPQPSTPMLTPSPPRRAPRRSTSRPQNPQNLATAGPRTPRRGSGAGGREYPHKPPSPSAQPNPAAQSTMPLRRPAATLAGRTAGWLSRFTRRGGGTAVSGLVTSTLDPTFVPDSLRQLHSTITITGTNGKTTTTAALCALARAAGQPVLTNPTGSNLERGLAAALLPHVNWTGQGP